MTVRWDPPGPGTWELDTTHFDPRASRITRDLMTEAFEEGFRVGLELVGAPLRTLNIGFVNGRMYTRLVPLVGGDRDLPLPPTPLLWLMTRLHPEFRRRAKRSVEAMEQRIWLAEYERWEREWKPRLIETNRQLGAVDETLLTDEALAAHLESLLEHLRWSSALHFRLHVSDMGPLGRLMIAARDWNLDQRAVMDVLAGSSPATRAPAEALVEIADELARCDSSPESLDDVRAASAMAASLLDSYLDEYGKRLTTGYDIRDLTLGEMPDVVLASILDAQGPDESAVARGDRSLAALRSDLGEEFRDDFDVLVNDARLLYGLRDENGPLTFQWPAGVLRRVVLEVGRRLLATGRIEDMEHLFDADASEMAALMRGSGTPKADKLRRRCERRMADAELTPKTVLGRPAQQPPIDVLPGRMPEMMRGVLMITELLDGDMQAIETASADLTGTGIGTASYRGIARVVATANEALDRAEPGDIIVTRLTVPTFNSILAMAGGVVTENGGLLCHTAVIARELGIPAVVGATGALRTIPDGAEIEVDPVAGRVTVISRQG